MAPAPAPAAPAAGLTTLPANVAFLDALAGWWLHRAGIQAGDGSGTGAGEAWLDRVADGLFLVPTRRAARGLSDAFLRAAGGRPLLLPRIAALGGLDETPLALSGALDRPAAVAAPRRLAVLSRMILAMGGRNGAPVTADRAWLLAADLAALLDEAARAEIDLAETLPNAVGREFAAHWNVTLEFLLIVTRYWPAWLAEEGLADPAARQIALLEAQRTAWSDMPPAHPVIAAGTTGAIPAVARLLRVVAGLPQGLVVLPGLDLDLDDAAWEALDDSHPQASLRRLLGGLGATRRDVARWDFAAGHAAPGELAPGRAAAGRTAGEEPARGPGPAPVCGEDRVAALRLALLPAPSLGQWRDVTGVTASGLQVLESADQQEEAQAVALVLREALAEPGARAALVTPDRGLAQRVTAELRRFGIVADDSAGEALSETPPAVFLRLLAQAWVEDLRPVALLALLKHPLCAAGLAPAACRAQARALERACLRGPAPPPGISGLRAARADGAFLDRLETGLSPLTMLDPAHATPAAALLPPHAMLSALLQAAENLAATADRDGATRLWQGEEGEALADIVAALLAAFADLPPQGRDVLPRLLEAGLAGITVNSRRAVRSLGRDGPGPGAASAPDSPLVSAPNSAPDNAPASAPASAPGAAPGDTQEHPRVFIWGLLEARLQAADTMVLGGLSEGIWPPLADPGPWMNRAMRKLAGLPSPEEAVGLAAHDFVSCACAAPNVVLSVSRRRDRAPAVPSRWLTRLEGLFEGFREALPRHPAAYWARQMDRPAGPALPVAPPAPSPAVALRPRRLSVTEIETWLRDPYAIYARHVLRLRKLKPIEEAADAADYGRIVHDGLQRFHDRFGIAWPADAERQLLACMDAALADAAMRPALAAWWRPRLHRIATWVAATEAQRRAEYRLSVIRSEQRGEWLFGAPAGDFTLTGRADRIERMVDGAIAILDYKTGAPPSQKQVEDGLAPQLTLEAAMVAAGAFGEDLAGRAVDLTYWQISGGHEPGRVRQLFKGDPSRVEAAAATAAEKLRELVAAFDAADRAYLSQPHPGSAPRFSDFGHLARVAEWAALDEEHGEGEQ